jgi:hypothetical protein
MISGRCMSPLTRGARSSGIFFRSSTSRLAVSVRTSGLSPPNVISRSRDQTGRPALILIAKLTRASGKAGQFGCPVLLELHAETGADPFSASGNIGKARINIGKGGLDHVLSSPNISARVPRDTPRFCARCCARHHLTCGSCCNRNQCHRHELEGNAVITPGSRECRPNTSGWSRTLVKRRQPPRAMGDPAIRRATSAAPPDSDPSTTLRHGLRAMGLQEIGGDHRRDHPRDRQAHQHRYDHGHAELLEELPETPGISRPAGTPRRSPSSSPAPQGRSRPPHRWTPDRRFAHAHMAHDILDLHDRIVDQHTGHKPQRQQEIWLSVKPSIP